MPVLTASIVALTPGLTVSGQLTATDPEGDTLTFSLGLPLAGNGLVVLAPNGSFTYQHQIFAGLSDTFGVVVTEDNGNTQSVTGTVQVLVTAMDATAPQIISVAPARAETGVLFTYTPVLSGFGAGNVNDCEFVLLPALAEAVSGTALNDPADYTFSGGLKSGGATGTLRITSPVAPADGGGYYRAGILVIDRVTNRAAYQPILIKMNPGDSG